MISKFAEAVSGFASHLATSPKTWPLLAASASFEVLKKRMNEHN